MPQANSIFSTINGVTISGTPTAGQVPTAVSGTLATWQTPSSGGSAVYLAALTDASSGSNMFVTSATAGTFSQSGLTNGGIMVSEQGDGTLRESYGYSNIQDNLSNNALPYSIFTGDFTAQMWLSIASFPGWTITSGYFRLALLFSGTGTDMTSNTTKQMGIKYLCAANGGSNFTQDTLQAVTGNGTSGTQTTLTGITLDQNKVFIRIVYTSAGGMAVYINGTLKTTVTTNIPSFGSTFGLFGFGIGNAGTNALKMILRDVVNSLNLA